MLVTGDVSPLDCSRGATPALAFGFPLFRFQGAPSAAARASDDALVLIRLLAGDFTRLASPVSSRRHASRPDEPVLGRLLKVHTSPRYVKKI